MKCPKCGADNPEGAEYCSLCLAQLGSPAQVSGTASPGQPQAQGEGYVAPGEWRGDAVMLKPRTSQIVASKKRELRWKSMVYGLIILAVVLWIVLSFTVWGNPSPGKVSSQLLDAVNGRDSEAFYRLFREENRASAEEIYSDVTDYLGDNGIYVDIEMDVDQAGQYTARSYIGGGAIELGGGRGQVVLDTSDSLVISLENRNGKWYVNPLGTVLIPL